MKLKKRHIIILTSLMCMLLVPGIAYTQDRIISIEKGQKTLTAVSATATEFKWIVDGIVLSETSGTLSETWATGTYSIVAYPIANSCIGDSFYVRLDVIEDITVMPLLSFVEKAVESCPPSNAKTSNQMIDAALLLSNYNIQEGESYAFKYTIDDGKAITSAPFKTKNASITINASDMQPGVHQVKVTRLMYGKGFMNQVDYSNSKSAPTLIINVKPNPTIGDIKYD